MSERVIPLGPVPSTWNIIPATNDDGPLVVINIQSAEGDKYFFVKPDVAKQIGETLISVSENPAKEDD